MSNFPGHLSPRSIMYGLAASTLAAPALAKAPLAGSPLRPKQFRGKLGAFEFVLVNDGGFWREKPGSFLATNADTADVSLKQSSHCAS